MPLTMVPTGEPNVIKKIGGKEETRRFLENLGFVTGGMVTVVSEIGGNMLALLLLLVIQTGIPSTEITVLYVLLYCFTLVCVMFITFSFIQNLESSSDYFIRSTLL